MNKKNKLKLEERIMSDIKSGRLKLRSKYIFLAEKFGLGGVFGFSLVLLVLFLSLLLFYLRSTDTLLYLTFGLDGLKSFLESLPYVLLFSLAVLILIVGYLLTKFEFVYRQPLKYIFLGILILVIISASFLAFNRRGEKLGEEIILGNCRGPIKLFHPFLNRGLAKRHHARRGIIRIISGNYLVIQNRFGQLKLKLLPGALTESLHVGDYIIAVGRSSSQEFIVNKLRLIKQNDLPFMLRHHGVLWQN